MGSVAFADIMTSTVLLLGGCENTHTLPAALLLKAGSEGDLAKTFRQVLPVAALLLVVSHV